MPIEPGTPPERRDYMLKDTGAKIVLSESQYDEIGQKPRTLLNLNIETLGNRHACSSNPTYSTDSAARGPQSLTNSSNLAYIIYTSGSTGKPKGVMTMHHNVNRVVKNTNYIDINTNDRVLQLSNYAFDGSVFDIYGALTNGAALVLIKKEEVLAIHRLAGLIKREAVSLFFVTTALFNMLVEFGLDSFAQVRKVLFGGERVSVEHSRKALDHLGKDRILHVYGPTEATVYATYYPIAEIPQEAATVPIGKPIANTTIFILDKHIRPVPIGVHGEIYIGGKGVARGYLNHPELTAERFCLRRPEGSFYKNRPPDSHKNFLLTHSLLYKTGDLARWQADGKIEFLGRIDTQVKIRGYRIELGEIETCLTAHPNIKEAVVINRSDQDRHYLCAYYTGTTGGENRGQCSIPVQELKKYLEDKLPAYMIPACFVPLEKIPLNPNGKVQTLLLPQPLESDFHGGGTYKAPETNMQRLLAETWREILGREKVGIDDNFFDLGGNSLDIVKLGKKLNEKLGKEIPVVTLFTYPTISSLEHHLTKAETEPAPPEIPEHHAHLIDEGKDLMQLTLNKFNPGE